MLAESANPFLEQFQSIYAFLTNASNRALNDAAGAKGIDIYKEDDNFNVKGLADLFALTESSALYDPDSQKVAPTPRWRVANALSELLLNPETPSALFNAAADYVCSAMSDEGVNKAIYWQPDVLHKLIEYRLDWLGDSLAGKGTHAESQQTN